LTPGFSTYSTIESLTNKYGYAPWYDSVRVGATLYNPSTGIFYTYDDSAAVAAKTAYIKKKKLGGACVWALNDDDANGSLTKAIATGLIKRLLVLGGCRSSDVCHKQAASSQKGSSAANTRGPKPPNAAFAPQRWRQTRASRYKKSLAKYSQSFR
jgi:hypothetical protein